MTTQSRVRAGVPTGGQFAGLFRSEDEIQLGFRDASYRGWVEPENRKVSSAQRAAFRVDNAEVVIYRESDGGSELDLEKVVKVPNAGPGTKIETIRVMFARRQRGETVLIDLLTEGQWSRLDQRDLGPWAKDQSEMMNFWLPNHRESSYAEMEKKMDSALREAVAIIS